MFNDQNKQRAGVLALILFAVGLLSIMFHQRLSICDYWWHLKAGDWMWEHQTLPFRDVFSWYGARHQLYWVSHEWLSEVILSGFNTWMARLLGETNPYFSGYLWTALISFLIFGSVAFFNRETFFKNSYITLGWLSLGCLVFASVINPRPHMMSYLLFVLTVWSLERFRFKQSIKALACLPLWALLWANFHGGSSNLPYVLGLIYLIGGCFSFEWRGLVAKRWAWKEQLWLVFFTALSFMVLILNPHGAKMLIYPYENMGDEYMLSIIAEWFPPVFRLSGDLIALGFVLLIVCVLFFKKHPLPLIDFLLIGAFTYLAIGSVRFFPLLYLVASFVFLPHLVRCFEFEVELPLSLHRLGFQVVFGVVGVIFLMGWVWQLPIQKQTRFETYLSDEMVATLHALQPERLYNYYDLGSELIYQNIPVFVDGRADLYSRTILKDAVDLAFLNEEPRAIIDTYEFDYFLLFKDLPLAYYLQTQPEAVLLIEEGELVLYQWLGVFE